MHFYFGLNVMNDYIRQSCKQISFLVILFFLALGECSAHYSINLKKYKINSQDTVWSTLMTDAFIARHQEHISYDQSNPKWDYEQGVMLHAIWIVYNKTHDQKYFDYIKRDLDYYLSGSGKIKTYDFKKFRLDDITSGRTLLDLYQSTKEPKYKEAAELLRKQLSEQPRTPEGGFWHKEIYPEQMWLDGLYMAEPFYAHYAVLLNEQKDFADITKQFILMAKHARDPKTGLFYHGWDYSKKQKWADPVTGGSPVFWGRSIGWYLMGLVDVLDYLPKNNPRRPELISIFKGLCSSLLKFQDKKTHLWYNVIDKPGKEGNYLESSASAMFMYIFAKGANNGYLKKDYLNDARQVFIGLKDNLIKEGKDGYPSLINTCAGAGLGGEPYRDGSLEYYSSVPKSDDDFKAVGPFIMGAIELENAFTNPKLEAGKQNKNIVGLDNYFNNEWEKGKDGSEHRFHYIWEDSANSGFSKLGEVITNHGAEITELRYAPVITSLDKLSVYIIVDPDTPQENPHPNYIDDTSIKNIVRWVKSGGVLVLFANDKVNCEFKHLNRLAGNFGIHFNEDSRNDVTGKNYDMGKFDVLPNYPIFKDVKKIYMKEICTLKLSGNAKPILTNKGDIIMASSKLGKGFVFAVGDPWLYNEYIDNHKLPAGFENYKAAGNLFGWLLNMAK